MVPSHESRGMPFRRGKSVLSGNVVQVPITIPVNVCGNSVNIVALLNPTAGNVCAHK